MAEKVRLRGVEYSYVRAESGIEGVAAYNRVQGFTCLDGVGAPGGVWRKCCQFRWVFMGLGQDAFSRTAICYYTGVGERMWK